MQDSELHDFERDCSKKEHKGEKPTLFPVDFDLVEPRIRDIEMNLITYSFALVLLCWAVSLLLYLKSKWTNRNLYTASASLFWYLPKLLF